MAITVATEPDAQTHLLNDVVRDSVDFNRRPSVRSKSGCWKSAIFIIGAKVAEEFACFGITSNLISFLTGPLGQSTATAAESVNAWTGVASLLSLLGAFVADSFFGRYRTIILASLLYILALGLLSLSAAFHSSHTSHLENFDANNLENSLSFQDVLFFFALYLAALAQGSQLPCLQAFGADQFDEEDKQECKAKSTFFNWWYFSLSVGILVAQAVLTYVQDNLSWELGFGIPCIVMAVALLVFLLGSKTYRFRQNSDRSNPIRRIIRVFVKAARNWNVEYNVISADLPDHQRTKMKFLERALVSPNGDDESVCTINDVEDAKAMLGFVPIWCTCLGFTIIFQQSSTLFTKQGATMDRQITNAFQIPAASLQAFIGVSILVFIPIYDLLLVPLARATTKKPAGITMLQRIGAGLVLSFLAMVIAALVEKRRLAVAMKYGLVEEPTATIPMSIWWLLPQYTIIGVANALTIVGLQEFFYDQAPRELKGIGLALNFSVFGIGSFLSSLLISVIENATSHDSWFSNNLNRAHLDYFYWLLACISAVTVMLFIVFAKSYVYK